MRNSLRYIAAIIITIAALYFAFRGQDFDTLLAAMKSAQVVPLLLLVGLQLAAHLVRAWRWKYLLHPLKVKVSLWDSFKAVLIGYALNNVIPRSGEIARPAHISKVEGIPFTGALATIIVERIFDVLALVVLVLFALATSKNEIESAFPDLSGSALPVLFAIAVGLMIFVLLFVSKRFEATLTRLIAKILPNKIAIKIESLLKAFVSGLQGVEKRSIASLIFGTVSIWVLYGLSMYFSFTVLPGSGIENISLSGAFLLLMLSAIAVTIPTPGGAGTYHYLISKGLIYIFAIDQTSAVAFVTITHGVQYIFITLIGIIIAFVEGVKMKAQKEETT